MVGISDNQTDLDAPSLLDPDDWQAFKEQAHRALDVALEHMQQRPAAPVWQEIPAAVKALENSLPTAQTPLAELVAEVQQQVMPYTLGNTHPRFWGWVHGSGTASAVVSQMMIAALNANMGGRDHAPMYIERQVIQWMHQLFDYPVDASGIMCTGTSSATLLGLAVARQRAVGAGVRSHGNRGGQALVAYCSAQAHASVCKAIELLGLGHEALRSVPVRDDFSMDCDALEAMIAEDQQQGLLPFAIVSCVGSVNTGAIDDLPRINALGQAHNIWHHVDGAFGALAMLSEPLKPLLAGITEADSIAFDFHKWMHVSYATGCLLVRDGELHRQTFEMNPAYLQGEAQGMAAGAPWPTDYGIDLSRGFSALAVWFQLKEMGTDKLGEAILRNCQQANWLGQTVAADPVLELLAAVSLNVVCFRWRGTSLSSAARNQLNKQIVVQLQCRGIAAPSYTELHGETAIRVCITNHRTRQRDLEALLTATREIAQELERQL